MMTRYIAYYRTSTKEQNLGITAQQTTVKRFLKPDDILIEEYTEQESGKNDNRVELTKAIEHCRKSGSVLLIAKLDRLSRNLTFISQLMDSKLEFKCCDMPTANEFTIHIFAALAQQERHLISTRTKAALQELKSQGMVLGKPENLTDEVRLKGRTAYSNKARSNTNTIQVTQIIREKLSLTGDDAMSFVEIADYLNSLHYKTPRGKMFRSGTINMYVKRIRESAD